MTDLSAESGPEVLAACQTNAAKAAESLGRALGATFDLTPHPATNLDLADLPEGYQGSGLTLVLRFGQVAAVLALPEAGTMIPAWCAAADAAQQAKLEALAEELGALLVPEGLPPETVGVARVGDLAAAIGRGGPAEDTLCLPLAVEVGQQRAVMSLIWPLAHPDAILEGSSSDSLQGTDTPAPPTAAGGESPVASESPHPARAPVDPLDGLPDYARSLLKIKVPVRVKLASKRQSVGQIVELCPGSIITFAKTCDAMLELSAGQCMMAVGEAVKVDDKFGLRVISMTMPDERFGKVGPRR